MKFETQITFRQVLEVDNLATVLSEADRQKIIEHCKRLYEVDDASRRDWLEIRKNGLKTALQLQEEKSDPFPNCSNMRFPMLSMAILSFGGRAEKIMVKDGDICVYKPSNDQDPLLVAKCKRRGKFMNWLLCDGSKESMSEWMPGFDRSLHIVPTVDTIFKKTQWDDYLKRPVSELVMPQDFVVNNTCNPDSDPPRGTHIIPLYWNEVISRMESGAWLEVENVKKAMEEETRDDKGNQKSETLKGQGRPSAEIFLEQHTELDLDGDEYREPVIVTWHESTGELVRITRRFVIDDVVTESQFSEEVGERLPFIAPEEAVKMGDSEDVEEPEVEELGKIVSINPSSMFTKIELIPSFDGSYYGTGYNGIATPINDTIDSIINQIMDSTSMKNRGGGFLPKSVRLGKSGTVQVRWGEYIQTDATAAELQGITPYPVPDVSASSMPLLQTLLQVGDRLVSTTSVMSGEVPTAGVPNASMETAVEQGSVLYGSIIKRLYRSLRLELAKIDELVKRHMPIEQYLKVVGGTPQEQEQARLDFEGDDYEVTPIADITNLTTEEQKQRDNRLMALLQPGMPPLPPDVTNMIYVEHFKYIGCPEMGAALMQAFQQAKANPPPPNPMIEAEVQLKHAQAQLAGINAQKTQMEIEEVKASVQKIAAQIQEMGLKIQKGAALVKPEIDNINADTAHKEALATHVHSTTGHERMTADMGIHKGMKEDLKEMKGGANGQGETSVMAGQSGNAGINPASEYNP